MSISQLLTANFGQALVSVGNYAYEFAVNTQNGHVLYTYWWLGGGSQGWYDLGLSWGTLPLHLPPQRLRWERAYTSLSGAVIK